MGVANEFGECGDLDELESFVEAMLARVQGGGADIAEVPALPGCMAHGDSQEDALKSVNDAMQLWIETAKTNLATILEQRDIANVRSL